MCGHRSPPPRRARSAETLLSHGQPAGRADERERERSSHAVADRQPEGRIDWTKPTPASMSHSPSESACPSSSAFGAAAFWTRSRCERHWSGHLPARATPAFSKARRPMRSPSRPSNISGPSSLTTASGFAGSRSMLRALPVALDRPGGSPKRRWTAGGSAASRLEAQLRSAARHTGWPRELQADEGAPAAKRLASIGFGSNHDRLDAHLSAWIASLDEAAREPFGEPPDDVIWVPRVAATG